MGQTIAEQLGAYIAAEKSRTLPPEVIHHAKRALIDWFAAMLPGTAISPAQELRAALDDEIGLGGAWLYGFEKFAPLRTAALINGAASHAVEFDDIFRDAGYHPGSPTIAAALAAAQANKADAATLLKAIVIGYEVSTRIGLAVMPSHYKYWHTTGTVGTFGAAAAVASVLGLCAARAAHGLASSVTMAAGLQQTFRSESMTKPMHAAHAAEAGALAAMAAGRGMTCALDMFEGEAGFGAAMSTGANWSRATDGLGTAYNITQMTFKNHGCCGHAFPAIDGALFLQQTERFAPADVRRIHIGGYRPTVEVAGIKTASTPFEGKFSTPFLVASALVHGSVRLNAYDPERLADPVVQALSRRVDLEIDPECAAGYPSQRAAKVTVELEDGRKLYRFQPTRKGDPDDPLSDAELSAKFMELASPVLGEAPAKQVLSDLWACNQAHALFAVPNQRTAAA